MWYKRLRWLLLPWRPHHAELYPELWAETNPVFLKLYLVRVFATAMRRVINRSHDIDLFKSIAPSRNKKSWSSVIRCLPATDERYHHKNGWDIKKKMPFTDPFFLLGLDFCLPEVSPKVPVLSRVSAVWFFCLKFECWWVVSSLNPNIAEFSICILINRSNVVALKQTHHLLHESEPSEGAEKQMLPSVKTWWIWSRKKTKVLPCMILTTGHLKLLKGYEVAGCGSRNS